MGVQYELWWRGDEILGVSPRDNHYPFFPEFVAK